jgi:hypothetical protein
MLKVLLSLLLLVLPSITLAADNGLVPDQSGSQLQPQSSSQSQASTTPNPSSGTDGSDVLQPSSQSLQPAGVGGASQSPTSADSLQVTTPRDQVQQLLAGEGDHPQTLSSGSISDWWLLAIPVVALLLYLVIWRRPQTAENPGPSQVTNSDAPKPRAKHKKRRKSRR